MNHRKTVFLTGLISALANAGVSKAALLTSDFYSQELWGMEAGDPNTYTQAFSGSTLPFIQSETLDLPDTSELNVSYDFEDNASSASFNISGSASLFQRNEEFSESDGEVRNQGIFFTPIVDATYVFQFAATGSAGSTSAGTFEMDDETARTTSILNIGQSNVYETGILAAGHTYDLAQDWDFFLPYKTVPSATGSSSLSFTLTAIPEPSSVMMLFGSAVLLLKRPMRWTKVGLSNAYK